MKKNSISYLNKMLSASHDRYQFDNTPLIDFILIGGGIMSATLGTYIKVLEPNWSIHIYERLKKTAEESSNGWHNSGTGHAAFCELNYTNCSSDGFIDISKAIEINEHFSMSCQFWAYLVKQKILTCPQSFINNIPHISFVWGEDNVNFLRKRFYALQTSTLFQGMEYSEDPYQIYKWAPLVMNGRNKLQKVAATRMNMGTDIDFGEITQQLLERLKQHPKFHLYLQHEVVDIKRNSDQTWSLSIINHSNNSQKYTVHANYVFIGAGGASLTLLQKSGIPESNYYAGFPVSGKFLVTKNPKVLDHHYAKVYGRAPINSAPISVPHMDTRIFDSKPILLFGPFANLSSKFLKQGSWLDLFHSLTIKNILPIICVGRDNLKLIRYLINQVLMSDKDRLNILREYYPQADMKDWTLIEAGQRVQIIKKDVDKGGMLQFGTELVISNDGSLAALLGASPGASTSATIMLELLASMFKYRITTDDWQQKLKQIFPFYGQQVNGNIAITNTIRKSIAETLGLIYIEAKS